MTLDLQTLANFLNGHRFRLTTERALQDDIETAFQTAELAYRREHRLPGAGIVDFMVGRVAIEAKVAGAKRDIHRQCARYADHADVDALILATTVTMPLPSLSVPALVVNLGRAWL